MSTRGRARPTPDRGTLTADLSGARRGAVADALVLVTTALQATARDASAVAAGIPSRALMRQAGAAAAAEITRRYAHRLSRGVAVYSGGGNNGGDAWVVARTLAATGVRVRVHEVEGARSPDAIAERSAAQSLIEPGPPHGGEEVVVDGILGTGHVAHRAERSPRGSGR